SSPAILHFSRQDIDNKTVKSTGSVDLTQQANDLASGMSLSVTPTTTSPNPLIQAALNTISSFVQPAVQAALSAALPAIIAALPATTQPSGLELGTMDVTATSARCGVPVLVR